MATHNKKLKKDEFFSKFLKVNKLFTNLRESRRVVHISLAAVENDLSAILSAGVQLLDSRDCEPDLRLRLGW